jgi:hypothetical protein
VQRVNTHGQTFGYSKKKALAMVKEAQEVKSGNKDPGEDSPCFWWELSVRIG